MVEIGVGVNIDHSRMILLYLTARISCYDVVEKKGCIIRLNRNYIYIYIYKAFIVYNATQFCKNGASDIAVASSPVMLLLHMPYVLMKYEWSETIEYGYQ